ncbi:MAG: signal peptide peptidase SppA [Bacteroidota bacterium]
MTKSTKWFLGILAVLAILATAFLLAFISLLSSTSDRTETVTVGSGDKLAIVELRGEIVSPDEVVRQIKKYRDSRSIRAIVLHIDSPGGGVVASQEIYEEVRKVRDGGKPVIVSMGALAASGGYYVACGGSRLVANRGTLTGSIGVISEFLQVKNALDKLGIEIEIIKSGKLKDAGAPTRKMNDDDRKYFQSLMDRVHTQFMEVVERERSLSADRVRRLADGRVYTGEEAVALGLVDTVGTFEDAVRIAADIAGIQGEPAIVRERKRVPWYESFFGEAGAALRELKQDLLNRPVLSYKFTGPE